MMKLDRWLIVGAGLVATLGLTGCPDDTTTPADGSSDSTDEGPDDGQDDGQTSMLPTTVGQTGDTTAGPETSTSDTTAAVDTVGDDTTSGTTGDVTGTDTGTTSTTGEIELCDVMLPPPAECGMEAPGGAWRFTRLSGDWNVDGSWVPNDDFAPAPDTQLGGGGGGSTGSSGGSESETDFGESSSFIGFIQQPDFPVGMECNPIEQDCPEGEKCMPWANDGGSSWNSTRCTPVAENPNQIGDSCSVEGTGVSGIDDCDIGMMCWDVDGETNVGECIELCSCSYDNPICETANTSCVISNSESLTICLPVCNPLDVTTCEDGQGCYPFDDLFHCAANVGQDAEQGDTCQFINACDAGQACATFDGCPGGSCCAEFCNLDAPSCPGGTTCTEWYGDGVAPDMCLGSTGICT